MHNNCANTSAKLLCAAGKACPPCSCCVSDKAVTGKRPMLHKDNPRQGPPQGCWQHDGFGLHLMLPTAHLVAAARSHRGAHEGVMHCQGAVHDFRVPFPQCSGAWGVAVGAFHGVGGVEAEGLRAVTPCAWLSGLVTCPHASAATTQQP